MKHSNGPDSGLRRPIQDLLRSALPIRYATRHGNNRDRAFSGPINSGRSIPARNRHLTAYRATDAIRGNSTTDTTSLVTGQRQTRHHMTTAT